MQRLLLFKANSVNVYNYVLYYTKTAWGKSEHTETFMSILSKSNQTLSIIQKMFCYVVHVKLFTLHCILCLSALHDIKVLFRLVWQRLIWIHQLFHQMKSVFIKTLVMAEVGSMNTPETLSHWDLSRHVDLLLQGHSILQLNARRYPHGKISSIGLVFFIQLFYKY